MGKQHRPKRFSRIFLGIILGLAVVFLLGAVWFYDKLTESLPQLDGRIVLEGLSAPVEIERDALGIPTLRGQNRPDVARATGFVHAQERFFQMDLLRRKAAGELAALFGEAALAADQAVRIHRFRSRARQVFAALTPQRQMLIEAYAAGVNAGLQALATPPFEYLVLRDTPSPWLPEDTLLVIYAMYLDLQGDQWSRESMYGLMDDLLPRPLYEFLAPRGTEWDAPLQGMPFKTPPVPGPEVIDLRSRPLPAQLDKTHRSLQNRNVPGTTLGSNNWAVVGSLTRHGGTMLANDMHLRLAVPNIWYRISLVYPGEDGRQRRITGVTLPGTPAVVVGSNGRIAWGFTNSNGDWSDLVILRPVADDPKAYLTPDGPRPFEYYRETIQVKNAEDRVLEIPETLWGPVIDRDHHHRQRALRWVAHDPEGVNMEILDLETATTIAEALEIANRTGAPAQNILVVDAQGNIGWTLLGPIPRRFGHDGRVPRSWAAGDRGWSGWLTVDRYPRIVNPAHGRLWTANARVVEGEDLARLGDGGYDLGARARQIRDSLFAMEKIDEKDMLTLQLNDRALFLQHWRDFLLDVLNPEALAADPRRRTLRRYLENWRGRAAIDSVGFRMVRDFRRLLREHILVPLTAPCTLADPRFDYAWIKQWEGPLWRLVEERPPHLLNPRFKTWQEQFLAVVDALLERFTGDGSQLGQHTWGEYNTVRIRHPLSRFIPLAGRWLDMPAIPLPGAPHMPRVQSPTHGASQRMVVSPGHEAEGIFEMPVGQSGHLLSPYYRNSHEAWVKGKPSPFLPGPAQHVLNLVPASAEARH